jgi:hypothetical protein
MNGPLHMSSGKSARAQRLRDFRTLAAKTLLAVIAFGTLTLVSLQSFHAISARSSPAQSHQWERDEAFWNCLTVQAHSLVAAGQRVQINQAALPARVTLEKIVGGWTILVTSAAKADAVLLIRTDHARTSCLGSVVVEYAPGANLHGHPEKIGTGASDPGNTPPPPTPL